MLNVRKSADIEIVSHLDELIFSPSDEKIKLEGTTWWIARENHDPVGFAGMVKLSHEPYGYFSRAGVLPAYRGKGIHSRMIQARLRWAKRQGWEGVMTYTVADNFASANNLISKGFRLFEPGRRWAGDHMLYFLLVFEDNVVRPEPDSCRRYAGLD